MEKRILSSFLSLVLVLSLMPVSALAAEGPQNVAPAVVTEEPGEVHGEPPVEEAAGPEEPACICESPLYRGDREHGLPHLHGGLYRLYL